MLPVAMLSPFTPVHAPAGPGNTPLRCDDSRNADSVAAKRPSGTSEALPNAETSPPVRIERGRSAIDLYATVLQSRSFDAAAHALVSELARNFGLTAATMALHRAGRTRLVAASHLDMTNPQDERAQCLLGAMDEAIEQSVSLSWPPAVDAAGAVTDWIRVEHEALNRRVGAAVATVPLGRDGDVFGAVCVQRDTAVPWSCADLERLEDLLTLAAPALRWMQQGGESATMRVRRDLRHAWDGLRQPDRLTTRRLLLAGMLVLLFLAVAPLERTVGGRARVQGAEQRVLSAPADGFVKTAHVRPGDRVRAGDALVDLLDGDLRLELERWGSQLAQHENAYAAAMARADRTLAATSLSRISEAQSQQALVEEQLGRGRVTAPFDALVIQGDLSQAIGTPVRQGDTLLTLATSGRYRVLVEVDEVDIGRVKVGQTGRLSISSFPWGGDAVRVERILPLARAVEGRNVFEVEASLPAPPAELRPGLLGRAELVVGRTPPLWGWTTHALERLRVAWWAWLG